MPKNPPAHAPGPAERPRPVLDEVDRAIVAELLRDGRAPNVVLARAAGVAESTCLARVRSLRERGILTGVTADVDLGRLGLPGVIATYNISGADDFLVHVATTTPEALRDFVLDNLTGRPGVVHAETSLVFHANRGRNVLPPR